MIKSNDINQYKSCTLPSTDKAIVSFFLPRGKNGTKNPPSLRLTRSSSMAKYLKVGDIRSAKRNERGGGGGHTVTFQLDNYISIEKNTGRTRITPSGEIIVRAGCHTQYCVHSYSCLMCSLALPFRVGVSMMFKGHKCTKKSTIKRSRTFKIVHAKCTKEYIISQLLIIITSEFYIYIFHALYKRVHGRVSSR